MSAVNIFFLVLLNVTCIAWVIFIINFSLKKDKNQSQRFLLIDTVAIFIWSSGILLQTYIKLFFGYESMLVTYLYSIGAYGIPVHALFFVISFVKPETRFNYKWLWLFSVPLIHWVFLLTNDYHHLLFIHYAVDGTYVYGPAIFFFFGFDMILLIVSISYLYYYLVNNFKIFLKQSLILILGLLIPMVVNIIIVFKIVEIPLYANPTSCSLALLIIYYGITKCDLLKINPISLKVILDAISDCLIILDRKFKVIGYNRSFMTQCKTMGFDIKNDFLTNFSDKNLVNHLEKALEKNSNEKFEYEISCESIRKHYLFEVIPLRINNSIPGIVVIFKDITEITEKNLQLERLLDELKGTQDLLVLNERYSSLGMLFGGIAHSLKSPLVAMAANINIMQGLVSEYKTTIVNHEFIIEDHLEIAAEMEDWLGKTHLALEYINNALNSIKGQISNYKNEEKFKISDVLERINTVTKFELINQKYVLKISNLVENDLELNGSLNYLVQVINNLIMNSKQAYHLENGTVELSVERKDQNVVFMVKDFGEGISEGIQDKLFKEMVTTKGKGGAGLGLYISYSIIKSQFNGEIRFESKAGKGTVFYITLPLKKGINQE